MKTSQLHFFLAPNYFLKVIKKSMITHVKDGQFVAWWMTFSNYKNHDKMINFKNEGRRFCPWHTRCVQQVRRSMTLFSWFTSNNNNNGLRLFLWSCLNWEFSSISLFSTFLGIQERRSDWTGNVLTLNHIKDKSWIYISIIQFC